MEGVDNGIAYEGYWGNPELKPPGSVTVEQGENRQRIPYELEIDQVKLEEFLRQEGVVKGRAVKVKFFYPRQSIVGKIFRGGEGNGEEDGTPKYWGGRAVRAEGNTSVVEINAGGIYELATALPYQSQGALTERVRVMTAFVLGHELQHLRQPGQENEYHELEITKHKGVLGFAENILQEVRMVATPGEIEANKIGLKNTGRLAELVRVRVQDQEMLDRDDFWGKVLSLGKEARDMIEGGFNQGRDNDIK